MVAVVTRPPIRTGTDGLPHCGACAAGALCGYHRREIERELNGLLSAHTLAAATIDLRYIVNKVYKRSRHTQEA